MACCSFAMFLRQFHKSKKQLPTYSNHVTLYAKNLFVEKHDISTSFHGVCAHLSGFRWLQQKKIIRWTCLIIIDERTKRKVSCFERKRETLWGLMHLYVFFNGLNAFVTHGKLSGWCRLWRYRYHKMPFHCQPDINKFTLYHSLCDLPNTKSSQQTFKCPDMQNNIFPFADLSKRRGLLLPKLKHSKAGMGL